MVTLLLGLHNHQPEGNFDRVLEAAFQRAYDPFLDVLERHPSVKISLHASGCLWEWAEGRRPDYLARVKALSERGQIELLGGAFYEPILSILPERDQKGQISLMGEFLESRFGVRPKGFWLAERVWEPELPRVLAAAGVDYTIVDDTHFLAAGFAPEELTGYFLSESGGKEVAVFPISQKLRYLMPFRPPEETIDFLKGFAGREKDPALVMADDGEKFGLWPRTHDLVYAGGWLERLFSLLEDNADWLKTARMSDHRDAVRPRGWAFLPTSSYAELGEWALRPEAASLLRAELHKPAGGPSRFLRGGYFRNFFTKYPESNRLYRKMLRTSGKVHRLEHPRLKARERARHERARRLLWKGQCNCGYWHGVFGGLYLPHLRHALYERLLAAEREADRLKAGEFVTAWEDWDADGRPELLAECREANWYLSPAGGGALWEWDLKARGVNLAALVNRRREAYHADLPRAVVLDSGADAPSRSIHDLVLAKEPGLERHLTYDWHGRASLLDHFLHPDTRLEDFASARYGEQGDFVLGAYEIAQPGRVDRGRLTLALERRGLVWDRQARRPIRVRKDLTLGPGPGWRAEYELVNLGEEAATLWFGVELALAFVSAEVHGGAPKDETLERVVLEDPARGLSVGLAFDSPMGLWSFPLYTVSLSEEGFEKTYQGTILLAHRKLDLPGGGRARMTVAAGIP